MANLGYLQLVRHCNQYCRICSNPETPWVLDLDAAIRALDDFAQRGYAGVILTGGEPSLSEIVEEHTAILKALENGDADRAATAMKEHLVNTAALLLKQEAGRDSELSLGWEKLVVG